MLNKEAQRFKLKGMAGILHVVMVAVILMCLIHLLQVMTMEVVLLSRHPQTPLSHSSQVDPAKRSFRFLLDGTVHQIYDTGEHDPNGLSILEVYDVNDVLLTRGPKQERKVGSYLSFSRDIDDYSRRSLRSTYGITPGFSGVMDVPVFKGKDLEEVWRYNLRRQIFVGYDRMGMPIGCLGQQGLAVNASDALGMGKLQAFEVRWPSSKDRPLLLWETQNNLYEIDVKLRQVERFIDREDATIGRVLSQAWSQKNKRDWKYVDPNLYRPLVVCQTGQSYHLALREPDQRITVTLPERDNELHGHCEFVATKTDLFLKQWWTEFPPLALDASTKERQQWMEDYRSTKKRHWTELYRVGGNGDLERIHSLNWMETRLFDSPKRTGLPWTGERVISCLSPGIYNWIYSLITRHYHSHLDRDSFIVAILRLAPKGIWDCWFSSLCLLFIALWHGRKRWASKVQGLPWLCLIVAFNLVGFLTYLALNHTPLIRCESCGKKRGVKQDACPRCHASLPEPEQTRPHLVMA